MINIDLKEKTDLCDYCGHPFGDCSHIVTRTNDCSKIGSYHPICSNYLEYLKEKEHWENSLFFDNEEDKKYHLLKCENKYKKSIEHIKGLNLKV